jgi:hypothetical protein
VVALKSWTACVLSELAVPFEVALDGQLLTAPFTLQINQRLALEFPHGPARPRNTRISLAAPEGDCRFSLLILGRTLATDMAVRAGRVFSLAYDNDYELSSFTITELNAAARPAVASRPSQLFGCLLGTLGLCFSRCRQAPQAEFAPLASEDSSALRAAASPSSPRPRGRQVEPDVLTSSRAFVVPVTNSSVFALEATLGRSALRLCSRVCCRRVRGYACGVRLSGTRCAQLSHPDRSRCKALGNPRRLLSEAGTQWTRDGHALA